MLVVGQSYMRFLCLATHPLIHHACGREDSHLNSYIVAYITADVAWKTVVKLFEMYQRSAQFVKQRETNNQERWKSECAQLKEKLPILHGPPATRRLLCLVYFSVRCRYNVIGSTAHATLVPQNYIKTTYWWAQNEHALPLLHAFCIWHYFHLVTHCCTG